MGDKLLCMFTTKFLLKLALKSVSRPLHVDANYKMTGQGFPVMLPGPTDMNRSHFPLGIFVLKSD
jgi:hypothetical protein